MKVHPSVVEKVNKVIAGAVGDVIVATRSKSEGGRRITRREAMGILNNVRDGLFSMLEVDVTASFKDGDGKAHALVADVYDGKTLIGKTPLTVKMNQHGYRSLTLVHDLPHCQFVGSASLTAEELAFDVALEKVMKPEPSKE